MSIIGLNAKHKSLSFKLQAIEMEEETVAQSGVESKECPSYLSEFCWPAFTRNIETSNSVNK
ncbi:MAG: hypothetical protein WAX53_05045 [Enterococcus aquimarinus]